jgi:hypothetical protein
VPPNELPLGAWEDDRELIENAPATDRGDVSDLPPDVQFRVYVARLINRREQNSAAEYDQPAAFVLVSPDAYQEARAGRSEERLIHTGGRRLTGRIHFVTAAAMSSVVDEYTGDDKAMFERLTALALGNHPTLVYVPQRPASSLSYYPRGTATDEGIVDIPLKAGDVTPAAISAVIAAVHAHELVTPDQCEPFTIWKDASKGQPAEYAEKGIQQFLRIGLATFFAPFSIRREQPEKAGRTDLEIVNDRTGAPGHTVHHAVLELKVLRSRGSTGIAVSKPATDEHIRDGVQQAYSYGRGKNTRHKMLCCFDMRDTDEGDEKTFAHVQESATTLVVMLRRWFLYRSSEAYRTVLAAKT